MQMTDSTQSQQLVSCYSHLEFLKCVHYETHQLSPDIFTCKKHEYLFNIMHEKLTPRVSEPLESCVHTNGLCFFDFVSKTMRETLVHNAYSNEPCQGVCFHKFLHALMAAYANNTLVYAEQYVSIRDNIKELEGKLLESGKPQVCFDHLPLLKQIHEYVGKEKNQCVLHQYLFDETKQSLKSHCNMMYSTCNTSCYYVETLHQIFDGEQKKREMVCVCDTECFHNFLCNTVVEHISGTASYSQFQRLSTSLPYQQYRSDRKNFNCPNGHNNFEHSLPQPQSQSQSQESLLQFQCKGDYSNSPPCRTPVCWDHLQFLKCMNSLTVGSHKNVCRCENHSDFFDRVTLQLAGRALPIAKCSDHCFFNRLVEELMDENQTKCPSNCFLQFTIALMEDDAEEKLEFPLSSESVQRLGTKKC